MRDSSKDLTIRAVETTAVTVPLTFPLGTSAAVVRQAPLLLLDLLTEEGPVGRCYLFGYTLGGVRAIAAHIREAADIIRGEKIAPQTLARMLARGLALLGVSGPVRMALSALDAAMWDAMAIAFDIPLVTLLGGRPRPVRAYNSSGLGLMTPEKPADEAEALLAGGFEGVKLRLGHGTLADDLAVLRAVRRRPPDHIAIMADYNQALSVAEAIRRGREPEREGIYWLEEPIRHDDYRGNASIARALQVPIQIGENFNGPEAMDEALSAAACDYVMPDLARIGGVTGWLEAAGMAAARGIELSSHLTPEFSAQLLAVSSTGHWLEYVDRADAILQQPLEIVNGHAVIPDRPGAGLVWDSDKLARLGAGPIG